MSDTFAPDVAPMAAPPGHTADPAPWTPPILMNEIVRLNGEPFVRIHGIDGLAPFLMHLPTDTDLWMFISSNGGLTAGRRDADGAFFPYRTVDQIHDAPFHTGPVTLVQWRRAQDPMRSWAPLAPDAVPSPDRERTLSKSTLGNRIVFEEWDRESQLGFGYRWAASDETGWVRSAWLENRGRDPVEIQLLDGLRNILPHGAPLRLQQQSSCLIDAYKRVDLDPATRLGVYSLTARIVDRPEPAEHLRATTAWLCGLPGATIALSSQAIRDFRAGRPVHGDRVLTGRPGSYLAVTRHVLGPGERLDWHIACDSALSHVQIAALGRRLEDPVALAPWIESALDRSSAALARIVAAADGLQVTAQETDCAHHLANVLYNILRGGGFISDYGFPRADFAGFLNARDSALARRHAALLAGMSERISLESMRRAADASGDPDLRRLVLEYLPLHLSRRHGDPSRPWNQFSIETRNSDGSVALRYAGNWRDLFQNWEALARSFPEYLPGLIAKFVNASTVDGFNPYRLTNQGVDWEVLDPHDPWSGIGYWGDHQIVYLTRLLESMRHHLPGRLDRMLAEEIYSYADVPYRLKPYAAQLADPHSTIAFDHARQKQVEARVARSGFDGRLLPAADGSVHHASLFEKLLVPVLAKMSCWVPDGGVWMNTERPEWNDANNALAGYGLSVVTMCALKRHLTVLDAMFSGGAADGARVAPEVAEWLRAVTAALQALPVRPAGGLHDDVARRKAMDALGSAFERYRGAVHERGFSDGTALAPGEARTLCRIAGDHLERSIRASRRDDGLYHAYNLLDLTAGAGRAAVRHLAEMLEGQVAVLGSGMLDATESADLVDALFASRLYVPQRNTFLLYPDRELPAFVNRNRIEETRAMAIPLIAEMLAARETSILDRDTASVLRFHADLSNARDAGTALDRLAANDRWASAVARDRAAVIELFIETFQHRTFTGRSGAMYAYEGIGSVYWHMVAKLLLAIQEAAFAARDAGAPDAVRERLAIAYERVRSGLGYKRTAADYGAFPTDPYSHTPAHAGAQQPGMTGQVKEEILTRFGELGVRVEDGVVAFDPFLLGAKEFLARPASLEMPAAREGGRRLDVPAGALAFTMCRVPVLYFRTRGERWIRVIAPADIATEREGCRLTAQESAALFARSDAVARIEVGIPEQTLR